MDPVLGLVSKYGIFYIKLRAKHFLTQITQQSEELKNDIYFTADECLIYNFYNIFDSKAISIKCKIAFDEEGVYSKFKNNLTDIVWRQYFIRRVLIGTNHDPIPSPNTKRKEPDILITVEAAAYLRISKKTLQNYVSEQKIKSLKGGKLKKEELEKYLAKGKR